MPTTKIKSRATDAEMESDPFGERAEFPYRKRLQLLGAQVCFESNDRTLLGLVDDAFAELPRHRFAGRAPDLRIRLVLTKGRSASRRGEPPPLDLMSLGGMLGGITDSSNSVMLSPEDRSGLVAVSPTMLRYPYHIRYELIEFAVLTLCARVQNLVSLHAACVGLDGRGVILMGPSGAGKSTVALHCLLDGFEFLSEDSVFVRPSGMLATGVANFLHTRAESLRWLRRSAAAAAIRASPQIRRRSGATKYEVDLRRPPFKLAKCPLEIVSIIFLSSRPAGMNPLLRPLSRTALADNLAGLQSYGASQPPWREFSKNASRISAFELRRGHHPMDAAHALRSLLTR